MIRRITASDPRFRSFELEAGFNLIVARRSAGATSRDSTNGLGKSAVLRLIHFLLGASPVKDRDVPYVPALNGWSFRMELERDGTRTWVERAVGATSVTVEHAPPNWGLPLGGSPARLTEKEWRDLLRLQVFGLAPDAPGPSARQLFSYLARYESAHFNQAFDLGAKGPTAPARAASAWLLGLPASLPLEFAAEESRETDLKAVKSRIAKEGYPGLKATRPALEAERARLLALVAQLESERSRYELKEQSLSIKARADELTKQFNRLRDSIADTAALITHYEAASNAEAAPHDAQLVAALYDEAKVWLPEHVTRRLAEVQAFHAQLISNRAAFLAGKLAELRREHGDLQKQAQTVDAARAPLLALLAEDGAIESYSAAQTALTDARRDLATADAQLAMLRGVDDELERVKDGKRQLGQRAAVVHDEYEPLRSRAQMLFSDFVRSAFHEEGSLRIDLTDPRYRFEPYIPSKGSGGVAKLAMVGVDLTIARLLHGRGTGPGLLVHDSPCFDGMDARQIAGTLNTAWRESTDCGYTYLALLNEDQFVRAKPNLQLPDIEQYIRLTLRDTDPTGGLFGFRFA